MSSLRLGNAGRIAELHGVNLMKRIATLEAVCSELSRDAGEGEVIGNAFDGEVQIVTRDASGRWSERRERAH